MGVYKNEETKTELYRNRKYDIDNRFYGFCRGMNVIKHLCAVKQKESIWPLFISLKIDIVITNAT